MTLGETRVGIDFNPGGNKRIECLKAGFADLIDQVAGLDDHGDGELRRLKAVAMTEIEGAAMWAVKAAARSKAG